MTAFLEFYVRFFALALPLFAMAILMLGAARAQLSSRQTMMAGLVAVALFGLWYAAVVPASISGLLKVPPTLQDPPVGLAFLFGGTLTVWALAWLTPIGRSITTATPLSTIAAFQIPRLMGAVFLIGWLAGSIPAAFAIPAGLGDIWAGVAAWQASRALARGAPNARRLLLRANVIGLADFVVAVSLGIMTSEGFAHILSPEMPNIINDYPLVLFPAFFVPIFAGFHLIAISRVRADKSTAPDSNPMPSAA